jgi:hypothetical protein
MFFTARCFLRFSDQPDEISAKLQVSHLITTNQTKDFLCDYLHTIETIDASGHSSFVFDVAILVQLDAVAPGSNPSVRVNVVTTTVSND